MLSNHPESNQELPDLQLDSLSRELKESIERAKTLVRSCKIGNYEET